MEEASCLQVKTRGAYYFLCFFLFCSLLFSCEREETITATYVEQQSQQNHTIHSIFFLDDYNAYALGGNFYLFGLAQSSSDMGLTWSVDTIGEKALTDYDLDQDTIFAAGYRGYFYDSDTITNLWSVARPDDRQDIHGIVHQDGVWTVAGGIAFQFGFIKQLDQNLKVLSYWETPGQMNGLTKTEDQTLHAVGYGQIYRSVDNGQTWLPNSQEGDNYQDVFFISNNIGWIVGQAGSILKTEDGGVSWMELRKPTTHSKENLLSVHFENDDEGVVVGEEGIVWSTSDGGATWGVVEDLPHYNYTSVHLRDQVIWLGSDKGHILRVFL